jgi:glutaredoxin
MKKILYVIIGIGILFGLYKLLSTPPKNNTSEKKAEVVVDNPDLIFYWGDGCPHCEKVKEWMIANNIDQKLKVNQKEVYKNTDNQKELATTVSQYCPELNQGGIGVPLGFDPVNKKCIQGDTPIIDFLSQKVK